MTIHYNGVWTQARVEHLTTLWAKGESASAISAVIGGGISRNGVIGKVHRLKLPDPAGKRVQKRGAERRSRHNPFPVARAVEVTPPAPQAAKPGKITALSRFGETACEAPARRNPTHSITEKIAIAEAEPGLPPILRGEAPDGSGIKLIDLTEFTCRWPRGEPSAPDFEFCGAHTHAGPYCARHSRLAFEPPRSRVRRDAWALAGAPIQS